MWRGARAGRNPQPLFDTRFYAAQLSERNRGRNPLLHYLRIGASSGKNPCWWFDSNWYLQNQAVTLEGGATPLLDYRTVGVAQGRATHPLFDRKWYLNRYAGAIEHPDPIVDYIYSGALLGRVPHRALATAPNASGDPEAIEHMLVAAAGVKDPPPPRGIVRNGFDDAASRDFIATIRVRETTGGRRRLVSIIMATRDRAAMLPAAIESVLAQFYTTWELLVVDDGSRDSTEATVRGFDDARIRYVKGTGGGAATARNIGLAAARGDLIAYLDSDNRWTPEFLETLVGYLSTNDLDLAYSAMRLDSEDGVRFRGRGFDRDDLARVELH